MAHSLSYKTLAIYTSLIALYIYLPIIFLIIFSFKSGSSISFPIEGFTLFWYTGPITLGLQGGWINDPMMVSTLENSIATALIVAVFGTLACVGTGLYLRKEFRGKNVVFYSLLLGMLIPGVTHGLTNLVIFTKLSIPLSIWTAAFVQIVWAVPFGLILLMPRFDPKLLRYEEAARVLGASEWKVFKEITFPLIKPQFIGVILFMITLSFGELIRSFFVTPIASPTFPVYVYSQLTSQPQTPKYYAAGTTVVVISIVLMLLSAILVTRKR